MTTDPRMFRNASRPVIVECPTHDYHHGQLVKTRMRVMVSSIEMKSHQTKRWRTVWSARQEGSLGAHTGSSPREAIIRCLAMNPKRRPKWLAKAVKQVEENTRA